MQKFLKFFYNFVFVVTLGLAAVLVFVASQERFRNEVILNFLSHKRDILGHVVFKPKNSDLKLDILKVAGFNELALEVHITKTDQEDYREFKRYLLPYINDVHFHVGEQATNLAIVDLNQDGENKIITAAQDQELRSKLFIYRFNPTSKELELVDQ